MKKNGLYAGALLLALLVAGGLKLALVARGVVPFNADEAVVALMARHILQGQVPVFFYGQAYMGSLDALLVAGGFALFGQQVWVIRLVQGLLYLGTLATTAWLGKEVFGSRWVGLLAAGLLAVPTVNVTLYTTVSLGGYGEALLIGNLILILALRLGKALEAGAPGRPAQWLALGFLSGLGLWAFGLTLVYSLPAAAYLLAHLWKRFKAAQAEAPPASIQLSAVSAGAAVGGALLGAVPWLLFAVRNGPAQLLSELSGSAIASAEHAHWLWRIGQHFFNLLLLGVSVTFGLRPPWSASWLALPLLPLVLLFWMALLIYVIRRQRTLPALDPQRLLLGVILTLLAGFLLTSFGVDPTGRYFVPLAVPLALFAAAMLLDLHQGVGRWVWGLAALLLVYNLWGTVQAAREVPPGLTTQFNKVAVVDHDYMPELLDFLRSHGETRGYTNYWVSYPLAFLSQEELIFVPRLPYHEDFRYTERDDRYAPYGELVAGAGKVAYITTNHPALDQRLAEQFRALGLTWEETQIGDYHVFYALSETVRPEQMGLGITQGSQGK